MLETDDLDIGLLALAFQGHCRQNCRSNEVIAGADGMGWTERAIYKFSKQNDIDYNHCISVANGVEEPCAKILRELNRVRVERDVRVITISRRIYFATPELLPSD